MQEGTSALFALVSAAGRPLEACGRLCPSRAPAPVRGTPRGGGTGAAPVAGSPPALLGPAMPRGWPGDASGAEFPAPPFLSLPREDCRAAPLLPPRFSRGSPHPTGQALGTRGTRRDRGRGAARCRWGRPADTSPAPALQVMLLGDSGVGKTCFLLQFRDGAFLSGTFIATVGIDFRVRPPRPPALATQGTGGPGSPGPWGQAGGDGRMDGRMGASGLLGGLQTPNCPPPVGAGGC